MGEEDISMAPSNAFETLCERLGFPGSARLRAILEALMTPEQARLAEALPGTVAEVAERVGVPEDEAREDLDDLFSKGVVFVKGDFANRDAYRFARHVMQLHDASLATQQLMVPTHRSFFKLWHEFCLEEMYPAMVNVYQGLGKPPTRVVPAYKSVKDLPELLPHEDFHALLRAQETIAVVPCSCRNRTTSVDEQCSRHGESELWVCLQFGRGAEYVLARGSGRRLTTKQAIELADTAEDHGLIHMWGNSTAMTGVHTSCQCCDDCCMNAVSARRSQASIGIMWQKSRFEAFLAEPDQCTGCEDCAERCPFDAIEMVDAGNGAGLTPSISEEDCFGCGVCVVGCPSGGIKMRVARPPEFIPDMPAGQQVAH
jgi:Fe-S-cluster-containing hydrogenase component 2